MLRVPIRRGQHFFLPFYSHQRCRVISFRFWGSDTSNPESEDGGSRVEDSSRPPEDSDDSSRSAQIVTVGSGDQAPR